MNLNHLVWIICKMIINLQNIKCRNHLRKRGLIRLSCICKNIRRVRVWIFSGGMISLGKMGLLTWFYVGVNRFRKGFSFRSINRLCFRLLMIEERDKYWISTRHISEIHQQDRAFILDICSLMKEKNWNGFKRENTIQITILNWWLIKSHLQVFSSLKMKFLKKMLKKNLNKYFKLKTRRRKQ